MAYHNALNAHIITKNQTNSKIHKTILLPITLLEVVLFLLTLINHEKSCWSAHHNTYEAPKWAQ